MMHSNPIKVCAIRSLIVLHMDKASRPASLRVVDTVFRVRVFALAFLLVTRDAAASYHWEYNKESLSRHHVPGKPDSICFIPNVCVRLQEGHSICY